jgi:hypothetical protein
VVLQKEGGKPDDNTSESSAAGDAQKQAGAAAERAKQAAQDAAERASKATVQVQQQVSEAAKSSQQFLSALAQELMQGSRKGGASEQPPEGKGAERQRSSDGASTSETSGAGASDGAGSTAGAGASHAGSSNSGSSGTGGSAGQGIGAYASRLYNHARDTFSKVLGSSGNSAGAGAGPGGGAAAGEGARQDLVSRLRSEVAQAVLPVHSLPSVMKKRKDVEAVEIKVGEGPSDVVLTVRSRFLAAKRMFAMFETVLWCGCAHAHAVHTLMRCAAALARADRCRTQQQVARYHLVGGAICSRRRELKLLRAMQEKAKSWMDRLSERMGKNPLMDRINAMRASETAQRVSEGIQDVREKLDESEFVGRVQDMRQRLGEGNEAALTYREILMRHPKFDMPTFLQSIKQEVPVVIKVRQRHWLFCLHFDVVFVRTRRRDG